MTDLPTTRRPERQDRLRAVANNALLHLHPSSVRRSAIRFTYTWGLGGTAVTLVVLLLATGILLMFRYEPTVGGAYASIQALQTQTTFGALFRAIHHWSANLLIVVAFLHLLRVFLTGGFQRGRGLNWLVGLGLFLLVVLFNFTGCLLPWDQLAYWAVTVGTSLLGYIPIVGAPASRFLLGDPEVGQAALSNFYAIHVALLPALLMASMAYHFWRIRKDGGISQPDPEAGKPVERVTTLPHLLEREIAAAAVVVCGVVVWAMFVPAPLEAMANPLLSPNPAKAAWYFVGVQELLLHMHPLAAMTIMALAALGLVVLPRWDDDGRTIGIYFRDRNGRYAALVGLVAAIYLVPLLVVVDEYWLDLPALLPAWPAAITIGLLPLLATLLGLLLIYALVRRSLRASHAVALVGLYSFLFSSLVLLTIIGVYFRGSNMALGLPS